MSQEDYELEVLLELREQAREQAEQLHLDATLELQRRQQAAHAARQTLLDAQSARERSCREFDDALTRGPFDVARIHAFDDYLRGLKQHEASLAENILEAERAVEAQRHVIRRAHEAMVQAVKELEAVQAHHAQWLQEQSILNERKQSDVMDEIAARLWRQQSS